MSDRIEAELLKQAQPIIDRYVRICNPEYFETLKRCISDLELAARAVERAGAMLRCCPLDEVHWLDAADMPWMSDQPRSRHEIERQLLGTVSTCEAIALALQVASGAGEKHKSRREVPERVYIEATKDLIALYKQARNKSIEYPDPRSLKRSTRFIAQCLQAIDPDCDVAMAITCIRKALNWARIDGTDLMLGHEVPAPPASASAGTASVVNRGPDRGEITLEAVHRVPKRAAGDSSGA